jgi:hypothetical protein
VSRQALEQNGLMAVSVPESLVPGDNLLIRAPDGSDRGVISAVVSEGARPGYVLLVKMPADEAAPTVAMGIPIEADLLDTDTASHQQGKAGCGGGFSLCFVALVVISSVLYEHEH